jgi:hypothetical protein
VPVTDQPLRDRDDAEPETTEGLEEEQEDKGYGADEGEREQSLPDE